MTMEVLWFEIGHIPSFRGRPHGLMGRGKGMESSDLALNWAVPLSSCVTSDKSTALVLCVLCKIRLTFRISWSCYFIAVIVVSLCFLFCVHSLYFKNLLKYHWFIPQGKRDVHALQKLKNCYRTLQKRGQHFS